MRKFLLFSLMVWVAGCNGCDSSFLVGGTITGLNGTIVLQNNGADDLTLTTDGSFTFATRVAEGETYSVTVLTQPPGQVCDVTNGSNTIGNNDITNVSVNCVAALGSTTLIDVTPNIQTGVFSSYNSQRDQFLLTWWDIDEDSIDFLILNADGSIAVPYTLLFDTTITPLSDVASCYNAHLDQYFVVWSEFNTGSASFSILDSNGDVVQGVTTITGTHAPNGNVKCSFNSTDHQYFVTWVDNTQEIFFAIVNEDGTEDTAETSIPNVGGVQTSGTDVFSSYNSAENEYFLTWAGSDFTVYFAIYDAAGTAVQTATAIATSQGYSNVSHCYNRVNNEYFIPWYDTNGVTFFSIYSAAGTVVSAPQEIPDFLSDINFAPVFCSYNSIQNNYFLTAITPPTVLTDVIYTIVSDEGEIILEPTTIPNPSGLLTHKPVYSSFGETSDKTLITWTADDSASIFNGYSAFYSFAP